MKTLPIPFTEVMVKALLQNLKIMTRRTNGLKRVNENPDDWKIVVGDWSTNGVLFFNKYGYSDRMKPKFQIGDQLWVKETYTTLVPEHSVEPLKNKYIYKADFDTESEQKRKDFVAQGYPYKWITGRYMPKSAARIWLEVTGVKCERLQNISNEDAIAEGIIPISLSASNLVKQRQKYFDYSKPKQLFGDDLDPFWSFNALWCSINGGESWNTNPWVFVYTFKRIGKPAG